MIDANEVIGHIDHVRNVPYLRQLVNHIQERIQQLGFPPHQTKEEMQGLPVKKWVSPREEQATLEIAALREKIRLLEFAASASSAPLREIPNEPHAETQETQREEPEGQIIADAITQALAE